MTNAKLEAYRKQLLDLSAQVQDNVTDVTEQARQSNGGEASGGISNAPMHLGDLGTEAYMQELNSTLLETEEGMARDIAAALQRIDTGSFGVCEGCGKDIPAARLDAIPYTQYCVKCADGASTNPPSNLNKGRPRVPQDTFTDTDSPGISSRQPRDQPAPKKDRRPIPNSAAGTAGGGTASGGLGGTNVGHGDPDDVDLERATASSEFTLESEDLDSGFSDAHGGAVGGTPAGKRTAGGKTSRSK